MLRFPAVSLLRSRPFPALRAPVFAGFREGQGALAAVVLLLIGPGSGAGAGDDADPPAIRLMRLQRPLVIAHRGYSEVAPENTLPAFRLALAAGADLVELDYYHSKDGVPVVFHDATLDRTTDAVARWGGREIKLEAKTAAELSLLDAGAWFHAQFAGTGIPLLTGALETIQDGGVTLIERKGGDAATCVELLRGLKLTNQVIVQAFDWEYLRAYHELEPGQILGALGPPKMRNGRKLTDAEKALSAEWLDAARATGAKVVGWNWNVSGPAIRIAHERGLKVWVYTVNDPAEAEGFLDLGVDGIITDNPALIWKTLALREE